MRRFLVLLPTALLLTACGGGGAKESTQGGAVLQTVQISEKEYSLTPSTVNLSKPGTYAFQATNNGTVAHALEIEGNGVEEETDEFEPGSTMTLRVTLSKNGSYEMYCPVDGHKQEGMKGAVTVGGATSGGGGTTTTTPGTSTAPGY
jgi:plastocyanin